ncbi:MFS transporter [Microbacterium protaetiae]|nr:MFS transporter [Microbacterium protaetiae]
MTTTTITAPAVAPTRGIPHGISFWMIATVFLTQMAFCAVPTPLYAIYQQRDGFPTLVLTVIFVVYAVGVMLSLYLAGHLSDRLGRRRIILASLALNLVAAVLFLVWNDVAGLIVARFICGLGIGILTATATAHIAELGVAAGRSPLRSGIVSTFANLGGIGIGPLVAGVMATFIVQPLVAPYVLFAVLFIAEGLVVLFVPETVEQSAERFAYRPQRIAVPAAARGAYIAAAAAAFGAFAVFGTFTGLSSTFLVGLLGVRSHLLGGVVPFLVFMAAALAQIVTVRMAIRAQMMLALTAAVFGFAGLALGALAASLVLFLIGCGLAGAGVGIVFRASLGTVAGLADAARRGEALAGIFLVAYAGMTIPPLLTAAALTVWQVATVVVVIAVLMAALVVGSGWRMLREA